MHLAVLCWPVGIDSLDRTNVAQFCIGKCALGYQLFALGLIDSVHLTGGGAVDQVDRAGETASSEIVNILLDLYEGLGDELSQQYGGSAMHRSIKTDRSKDGKNTLTLSQSKSSTQPKEVLVSIRRHIQNAFQDTGKQDAINLFLGYFVPPATQTNTTTATETRTPHTRSSSMAERPVPSVASLLHTTQQIWDLSSDYYLHNPRHTSTVHRLRDIRTQRKASAARLADAIVAASSTNAQSRISRTTSEALAPRGGLLLELGHRLYPSDAWWREPIQQFERSLEGYLPDWLMSFPKNATIAQISEEKTDEDKQATTDETQELALAPPTSSSVGLCSPPRAHQPAYYTNAYAQSSLSSFDDLLASDLHKAHPVRILGGTGGTVNSPGLVGAAAAKAYAALIPRFLWRRNKAEDEEMDDDGDEDATATVATGSAGDASNAQLSVASIYASRFDEGLSANVSDSGALDSQAAPVGYAAHAPVHGMAALAGGIGSTSGNASHFAAPTAAGAAPAPKPPQLTPAQQADVTAEVACAEYLHGSFGRVLQADGSYATPSVTFPTVAERKLYHYLDHYAHVRAEHNLIVEPASAAASTQQHSNTRFAPLPLSPPTSATNATNAHHTGAKKTLPQHAPLPPGAPRVVVPVAVRAPSATSPVTPSTPSAALGVDLPVTPSPATKPTTAILGPPPSPMQLAQTTNRTPPALPPKRRAANANANAANTTANANATTASGTPPTHTQTIVQQPAAVPTAIPISVPAVPTAPSRSHAPSPSPSPSSLVFSHAPPHSSISIRNGKKATFYSAYRRRGEFDADFLQSTFEVARVVGTAPIVVEIENEAGSEDTYKRYVDIACGL